MALNIFRRTRKRWIMPPLDTLRSRERHLPPPNLFRGVCTDRRHANNNDTGRCACDSPHYPRAHSPLRLSFHRTTTTLLAPTSAYRHCTARAPSYRLSTTFSRKLRTGLRFLWAAALYENNILPSRSVAVVPSALRTPRTAPTALGSLTVACPSIACGLY